jgi:Protein of unknown function (DUF3106)
VTPIRLPLLAGVWLLAITLGAAAQVVDRSPTWVSLTPAQQQVLAPLQRDWASIDDNRKQKWIELAAKFPRMPADERQRVQARMTEWARMTPTQRAGARMQFQQARNLPAEERQAKWQAYQALTPEQRQALALRAKPVAKASSAADPGRAKARARAETASGTKRNEVVATGVAPTRVVAPTVVQARPGATTTSMAKRASPPLHHQAGLPKIAATPGFVDPATLLPRRGPQGAGARAAASADPASQP